MRLTRGADYGARGIIYLAKRPPDTVALVGDIASAEALPPSYLAKIFQSLVKEGILRSHRGAKGGFSLDRPAEEITLLEVIEAIDGPIGLCPCLVPSQGCEKMDTCSLYPVLAEAQEQMVEVLGSRTFDYLAAHDGKERLDLSSEEGASS
ncbi:MAG: Rrf2 family transcriptional regulator [Chloroflexota bacterium]|nr:Rrf2 family transcriptional regulator [Chloroflexota bacterium]